MSSTHSYGEFKAMPVGARRREAVRRYLVDHRGITRRVAARLAVSPTMVSKVLHGRAVSAPVERAIEAEEQEEEKQAA